ncbi:hypothetical protein OAH97_01450 [Octadecabacter sp.]|nr:hypothetical protein [Octadecabacter sp.]
MTTILDKAKVALLALTLVASPALADDVGVTVTNYGSGNVNVEVVVQKEVQRNQQGTSHGSQFPTPNFVDICYVYNPYNRAWAYEGLAHPMFLGSRCFFSFGMQIRSGFSYGAVTRIYL